MTIPFGARNVDADTVNVARPIVADGTCSPLARIARLVTAFLLSLLPVISAYSQQSVKLDIIAPDESLIYSSSQVRFGGSTDPGNSVAVNGKPVKVYPSGAFAGQVSLDVGENEIRFTATAPDGSTASEALTVTRREGWKPSPVDPPRFDFDYPFAPRGKWEVRPGDEIEVRVKASPGMEGRFKIGSRQETYPLRELSPSESWLRGIYVGSYIVQPDDIFYLARVTCYLTKPGDDFYTVKGLLPDTTISAIKQKETPIIYEVATEPLDMFAGSNFNVEKAVCRAMKGCRLEYLGRVDEKMKFHIAPGITAWARESDVQPAGDGYPRPSARLKSLSHSSSDVGVYLFLNLDQPRPFSVTEWPEQNRLTLRIYGARLGSFWQKPLVPDSIVRRISAEYVSDDIVDVHVALKQSTPWGYHGDYKNGTLHFLVREDIRKNRGNPKLEGLTIVLDPGHGGDKYGGLGNTGLMEKTANMHISRIVAEQLEKEGATIRFTYENLDEYIDLDERVQRAVNWQGDLFLSIHNDTVSSVADPFGARGTTLFYTHPHSRELAESIYTELLEIDTADPPRGIYKRDLRVTRALTLMPSVLVECRFLTHPEDEMDLLNDRELNRIADHISNGIVDFLSQKK